MGSHVIHLAGPAILKGNISIKTSNLGMNLRHMTGTFTNVASTPVAATPAPAGQMSCSAQVVPTG